MLWLSRQNRDKSSWDNFNKIILAPTTKPQMSKSMRLTRRHCGSAIFICVFLTCFAYLMLSGLTGRDVAYGRSYGYTSDDTERNGSFVKLYSNNDFYLSNISGFYNITKYSSYRTDMPNQYKKVADNTYTYKKLMDMPSKNRKVTDMPSQYRISTDMPLQHSKITDMSSQYRKITDMPLQYKTADKPYQYRKYLENKISKFVPNIHMEINNKAVDSSSWLSHTIDRLVDDLLDGTDTSTDSESQIHMSMDIVQDINTFSETESKIDTFRDTDSNVDTFADTKLNIDTFRETQSNVDIFRETESNFDTLRDTELHIDTIRYIQSNIDSLKSITSEMDTGNDIQSSKMKSSPFCVVYPLDKQVEDSTSYDCIQLSVPPYVPVCIHPIEVDILISAQIKDTGIWERHIVDHMTAILKSDPSLGLIDAGANIGMYSLIAAGMGHNVLAVEPYTANVDRLVTSVQLSGLQDKVVVLQNALADRRGPVKLLGNRDNQGDVRVASNQQRSTVSKNIATSETDYLEYHHTSKLFSLPNNKQNEYGLNYTNSILFDDLVPFIRFDRAILKSDIQGFEHKVFRHADMLFSKVYIPFVFMEWVLLRDFYGSEITVSEDKELTQKLVEYFTLKGYQPVSAITREELLTDYWYAWPEDVIWIHELAVFLM